MFVYTFNNFVYAQFSFLHFLFVLQDCVRLKEVFKQQFGKDIQEVELCVKGWNWGEPVFKGDLMNIAYGGLVVYM